VAVDSFGLKIPGRPEFIVDTEEVKARLADKSAVLVSVRSRAEYVGETSGYSYIEPKGHIPGAVWSPAGSDPYHLENLRNDHGTMRDYRVIENDWRNRGITPDKRVIFYCGTGARASVAFFYAYLMGWPAISVYDGGWLEWSLDKGNPIERGEA
jgi:thiosulfate/3-mercaptopyruvate sulfurtransferase